MPGGPHPPLSVILNWPLPNYVDPVTRGWGDVILCIALYVLALVTVLARLRARLVLQKNAGLDDLLIVIAMVIHAAPRFVALANLFRFPFSVLDSLLR